MEAKGKPVVKDLVLIGGGHSHAIALKLFGMNPLPELRLTLISDTSHTAYSGMLPGHVAGFYTFDETHIDLRRLTQFAQAQFYLDRSIGLDLVNNKVVCANHPPVTFDYLSIDIGSTPEKQDIVGAKYAIPAKPVGDFLIAWNQLLKAAEIISEKNLNISIVGGGAGGVELALNIQHHLLQLLPFDRVTINLFHRFDRLLSDRNQWVSNRLQQILLERGINLYLGENVKEILPDKVICASGLTINTDRTFLVTKASAPDWIKSSGLATDKNGFILVNNYLQSISHSHIFATGDIATMENYLRPKAGVFAVRQGKPLFENLRRIFLEKKLKQYIPQKQYLSLIGTGDKKAIASWWFLGWESSFAWRWKDYIDRQFMQKFSKLPTMEVTETQTNDRANSTPINNSMRCAGCGSKIGSSILEKVLNRLVIIDNQDVIIGLNNPDDAAVVRVPPDKLLVQTIDYFPSLISDPFIFGQIATNHCLSDLYAMGASPQTALALVSIPYSAEKIVIETLYQILSGANQVLIKNETSLVGGHTTEGLELAFGLACNGLINADQILRKSSIKIDQILIINKPIGTGTLFAADRLYQAKGRWIDEAVESMLLSNKLAAKIFLKYGATACTDITGFGLLGHLKEMLKNSSVGLELYWEKIPVLEGAIATLSQGIISSLHSQNLTAAHYINNSVNITNSPLYYLLFDPQTSGGLVATIPLEKVEECLTELKTAGYKYSSAIGRTIPPINPSQPILLGRC